jgi:DNA-binding PadR family transcriptional regulator
VQQLNATQGSLLGFLHAGPKTGWDLLQEVTRGLKRFWNVTPSHVYRELRVLEERKLIRAGEPGPRDRRPFSITPTGRAAFGRWIATEPPHEQIRFPLLITVWFGRHLDDRTLRRFVAAHRVDHEKRLAMYGETRELVTDDPYISAVVEFGIAYEEAVLAWLANLPFGATTDEPT